MPGRPTPGRIGGEPAWLRPDHERDCCGSPGSRAMWGCLFAGLFLVIGIILGIVLALLASGMGRLAARIWS